MGTCCSKAVNVTKDLIEYTCTKCPIGKFATYRKWDKSQDMATQTEPVILELLKKNDIKINLDLSGIRPQFGTQRPAGYSSGASSYRKIYGRRVVIFNKNVDFE